ncbi:MAG TPA: hypothetical protein VM864_15470 [Pyrinomonadaceae bacterium]|jgi:hypothetical protein|nr:hypothetical protein [Pyrinomonadaceae bacterium]
MKQRAFIFGRALALCALLCGASVGGAAARANANQGQPPAQTDKNAPQASDAEVKAAQAVQSATDINTAVAAVGEFIKKYPKSSLRPQVAGIVAGKLVAVQDPAQRATLAEGALKAFDRPDESAILHPVLVDAYVDAKRLDDAFRVAGVWLEKSPNEVRALTQLGLLGIDQARLGNAKFMPQSQQYAVKAVELMEADKKPADMSDADWASFKKEGLPKLYQSLGMLAYVSKNPAEARAKLEKSVALGSTDPTTYALLADMSDQEYSDNATKINAMKAGAEHDAALKQAYEKLDKVIELYAQAVALSEGKAGYEKMHEQLLPALTGYYKYRKGSTDGLQQLIDKYKKPAATP